MAGYLAKRLHFEYELVRPKGAFSGMVSAVTSTFDVKTSVRGSCEKTPSFDRFLVEIWIWALHRLPISIGATNWLTISIPLPTTISSWEVCANNPL